MVKEGIVLRHMISKRGIKVDKAKIDVTEKIPLSTNVNRVKSILGHTNFYYIFIKDFLKIAKPLSNIFAKDAPFDFNTNYVTTFLG